MSYVAVEEQSLKKFCTEGKVCFWVKVALVAPHESKDAYLFDCTMYRFAREEYRETPETRILLSFRSPIPHSDITFSGNLGYPVLASYDPCDEKTICNCIVEAIEYVESRLLEVEKDLKQIYDRAESLKKIVPLPLRDKALLKGVYQGLKVKQSILTDIAGKMGYTGSTLRAAVKPLHMLVSLDLRKKKYTALIHDKKIELKAHNRLVDLQELVKSLSYANTA